MTEALTKKAELARTMTLATLANLIVLFIVWRAIVLPAEHAMTIIAIHTIPLLLFLPGLLARKPKVFIWLCFVILLYFCQGIMSAFALPSALGILGALESILTTWLFCAAMMAARYYARLENLS